MSPRMSGGLRFPPAITPNMAPTGDRRGAKCEFSDPRHSGGAYRPRQF